MYRRVFCIVFFLVVLAFASSSSAALVAWYEFEGNVNDSVGANHGTVNGDPTYVAGKFGQAINFDFGGDDYVLVPDFDFATPSGDFTVSLWFKQSAYSITGDGQNYGYMVSYGHTNRNNSVTVFTRADDVADAMRVKSVCRLANPADPEDTTTSSGGVDHTFTTTQELTDGLWHMWTFTSSSSDGSAIYVDGAVVSTNPDFKGAPMNPAMDLNIGRKFDETRYYGAEGDDDGLLDDLAFWNVALSPSAVQDVYVNGVPEPGTVVLLGMGALALLRRRRSS